MRFIEGKTKLEDYINYSFDDTHLKGVVRQIVKVAIGVEMQIRYAGLNDVVGSTGTKNAYGEEVQKLDKFVDEQFIENNSCGGGLYAYGSEERENPVILNKNANYILYTDPLDGSSNINVDVGVGTIFGILDKRNGGLLQPGKKQLCVGYVLYGPSTILVISVNNKGVFGFTLDTKGGEFVLSLADIKVPKSGKIYSINDGYFENFPEKIRKYLEYLHSQKDYKSRYVGSMVLDIHRTFIDGGIYLYPEDLNHPDGKLRLLYEVAPVAKLVNNAGGLAIDSNGNYILDVIPSSTTDRIPFVAGSSRQVVEYTKIL